MRLVGAMLFLFVWRRRKQKNTAAEPALLVTDEATVVTTVLERAQAQLDTQLQSDDAMDLKALGVLGADAVGIGVLVAANADLAFWWVPTIVLGLAATLLLWVVWPLDLNDGPEWGAWYEQFGGGTPVDVGRQMLADLTQAVAVNGAKTRYKGYVFRLGFVILLLGLAGSIVVAVR
jgi:hypothetical protein